MSQVAHEAICEMCGQWDEHFTIDGQQAWSIEDPETIIALPIPNPLPSDARYREDLIWLRREKKNNAA